MYRKLLIGLVTALMLVAVVSVGAYAQGNLKEYTGYQVMNLATCSGCDAHVRVDYYGPSGGAPAKTQNLTIAPGASANVQQKTETDLPAGVYSAVLSSDQPIAAVVGQIESDPSSSALVYQTPFSDYTGISLGSTTVSLPSMEVNWFGIDSLARIQNVGDAPATVTIQYKAASIGGTLAGQASIAPKTVTIAKYAAYTLDPTQDAGSLVASSGSFQNRFFGSAVVTSDQPLAAIANETDVTKRTKFTYNGFGDADSGTELLAPGIFWQWFGTFTSLAVANPTSSTCSGTITYTAGANSKLIGGADGAGQTKQVTFSLAPGESRTAYEGAANQSDLADKFQIFGGGARITSSCKLVAKVNQTQYSANADGQIPSGSFNALPVATLTTKVAVPLIQADFYGYYTSLTCANADASNPASVAITYTSDSLSGVQNTPGTVNHTIPAGGTLIVYEAVQNGALADINKTTSPWFSNGTAKFNGSAFVSSTGTQKIACTVNEVGGTVKPGDNMNSYNGVNVNP
ncbi:MAG: hypothetical protein U0768_13695 [Anaerolineae bacterium]